MFILSLTYVKPQEEADRLMEPHMAWVNEGYDTGLFLASGRKVLADLAVNDPAAFGSIVEQVKAKLAAA